MLWPAWVLALLLVLSNILAVAAPVGMAMPMTTGMPAMHHSTAAMAAMVEPAASADPMSHHHHAAAMVDGVSAAAPEQHGSDCSCCDDGQCSCLQACNPLPQIASSPIDTSLPVASVPAPTRVAAATSVVDTPPLRPPIG